MTNGQDEVRLNVRVSAELRRAVKVYVAERDTTVEALVNEFLVATVAGDTNNDAARLRV
jgi:hypothetical protein